METPPSMAATAGGPPAYAAGECVYLAGKNRLLDDIDEHLLRSYPKSSLFLCYSKEEACSRPRWCFRVLELKTASLNAGGFFVMTDRSAEKPIVGDTALPYYFARHPANFRIWAPTSAELAMLEVPGHLHGNQIRRMLEVGGVDCNLFLLPQVSLRGAAGLGGGAAAIFRSVSVSPAVVPEGAQVVPALRSVTKMAGSNVSLQLCEFKDALLRLVIASAEGVVIRKETQTDTRSSKEKSHHQHSDSESSCNSSSTCNVQFRQSGGRLPSTIGAPLHVSSRSRKRGLSQETKEAEVRKSSCSPRRACGTADDGHGSPM